MEFVKSHILKIGKILDVSCKTKHSLNANDVHDVKRDTDVCHSVTNLEKKIFPIFKLRRSLTGILVLFLGHSIALKTFGEIRYIFQKIIVVKHSHLTY